MKKTLRRAAEAGLYCMLAAFAFCACYTFASWMPSLKDSVSYTVAAWVQAVGSIAAIAGATYIANDQYRRQKKERLRDSTFEAGVCCLEALSLIEDALTNIEKLGPKVEPVMKKQFLGILRGIYGGLVADMSTVPLRDMQSDDALRFAKAKSMMRKHEHGLATAMLSDPHPDELEGLIKMLTMAKACIGEVCQALERSNRDLGGAANSRPDLAPVFRIP